MKKIQWIHLTHLDDWNRIQDLSVEKPVMVYKHSYRCGISTMVQNRLERGWELTSSQITPYFLDLITHRSISNAIASDTGIHHESPQVIVISNKQVVYHASHGSIDAEAIAACIR